MIYLDYQATTPVDDRVLSEMLPFFNVHFGNPHSTDSEPGKLAEQSVIKARKYVAELIGAEEREIIFTSGATESNNLAIKGAANFFKGKKNHIITVSTEHKCVIESVNRLSKLGWKVTVLNVDQDGLIYPEQVESVISDKTLLVSVMAANNETGVLQPIDKIGKICRDKNVLFHTDAAQAAGKIHLNVQKMNIDLMSISSHKLYGPKGVGALYVCRRPRARLEPIIDGGGQERTLRSGTLPVPLVVGFGVAAKISIEVMESENKRILCLRDYFLNSLCNQLDNILLNGSKTQRLSHNLNLAIEGIIGEKLVQTLKKVVISTGSACNTTSIEPSYVLSAMGLNKKRALSSIRIALGRKTSKEDIDIAINEIKEKVRELREKNINVKN